MVFKSISGPNGKKKLYTDAYSYRDGRSVRVDPCMRAWPENSLTWNGQLHTYSSISYTTTSIYAHSYSS